MPIGGACALLRHDLLQYRHQIRLSRRHGEAAGANRRRPVQVAHQSAHLACALFNHQRLPLRRIGCR